MTTSAEDFWILTTVLVFHPLRCVVFFETDEENLTFH